MQGSGSNALRELSALTNQQIWLTLTIGAIGFGGMFGIYAYMASTLEDITGMSPKSVPLVMCLYGVGMTLGNIIVPRMVGRHVMGGLACLLAWPGLVCCYAGLISFCSASSLLDMYSGCTNRYERCCRYIITNPFNGCS